MPKPKDEPTVDEPTVIDKKQFIYKLLIEWVTAINGDRSEDADKLKNRIEFSLTQLSLEEKYFKKIKESIVKFKKIHEEESPLNPDLVKKEFDKIKDSLSKSVNKDKENKHEGKCISFFKEGMNNFISGFGEEIKTNQIINQYLSAIKEEEKTEQDKAITFENLSLHVVKDFLEFKKFFDVEFEKLKQWGVATKPLSSSNEYTKNTIPDSILAINKLFHPFGPEYVEKIMPVLIDFLFSKINEMNNIQDPQDANHSDFKLCKELTEQIKSNPDMKFNVVNGRSPALNKMCEKLKECDQILSGIKSEKINTEEKHQEHSSDINEIKDAPTQENEKAEPAQPQKRKTSKLREMAFKSAIWGGFAALLPVTVSTPVVATALSVAGAAIIGAPIACLAVATLGIGCFAVKKTLDWRKKKKNSSLEETQPSVRSNSQSMPRALSIKSNQPQAVIHHSIDGNSPSPARKKSKVLSYLKTTLYAGVSMTAIAMFQPGLIAAAAASITAITGGAAIPVLIGAAVFSAAFASKKTFSRIKNNKFGRIFCRSLQGAAVGTLVAGPVGTLVGAMHALGAVVPVTIATKIGLDAAVGAAGAAVLCCTKLREEGKNQTTSVTQVGMFSQKPPGEDIGKDQKMDLTLDGEPSTPSSSPS